MILAAVVHLMVAVGYVERVRSVCVSFGTRV